MPNIENPMPLSYRAVPIAVVALGALIGASLIATAQTPPDGKPSVPPEVMEPPGESASPPADPSTGGANPEDPLSKKLDAGEGVLEPPRGIDPEIRKPIPDGFEGKTPVIPPPGSPGGDPDVQPK